MFLAELRVENLRAFGEGEHALRLPLRPGLTVLVGENDSGKTTVIDALRFVLGMKDQEFLKVEETDYHQPSDGTARKKEIRVQCRFDRLANEDVATFAEYLSYEGTPQIPVLYVTWKANRLEVAGKPVTNVETRSGKRGDGPHLDPAVRTLLAATYLRPLRDAERAMSSGRGSRLSQILQQTKEVVEHGRDYDQGAEPALDPTELSILGIGDWANALLGGHPGIRNAQTRLNTQYLDQLSFGGQRLRGAISVSSGGADAKVRLRQLLEKFELGLRDEGMPEPPPGRGLGSNNVLFIACELLLLGSEEEALRLLLIEEPEAHLHPQRQLRLMHFLQERVTKSTEQPTQVITTTHSPNLASAVDVENMVLMHGGKGFPLAAERTLLDKEDYRFLQRFLDVTKANLFFARGILIVEGDAENILLPTVARLIGRDLTEHGVSIVNVGGTGLGRFARIYQRRFPTEDGEIDVPVACVCDLDIMPECAPVVLGLIADGAPLPPAGERRWRVRSDYPGATLEARRSELQGRADGQRVRTFVADHWTLEYDLAFAGLAREVWIATCLARDDAHICARTKRWQEVARQAIRTFRAMSRENLSPEVRATRLQRAYKGGTAVSKATTAQYLSEILEAQSRWGYRSADALEAVLPPYLVEAIKHVTSTIGAPVTASQWEV